MSSGGPRPALSLTTARCGPLSASPRPAAPEKPGGSGGRMAAGRPFPPPGARRDSNLLQDLCMPEGPGGTQSHLEHPQAHLTAGDELARGPAEMSRFKSVKLRISDETLIPTSQTTEEISSLPPPSHWTRGTLAASLRPKAPSHWTRGTLAASLRPKAPLPLDPRHAGGVAAS
ncbi:Hypp7875 [Branchiostoma lanceolatum]|uniref:Hypp7875 protein n=1 Tax=Branchiostoma lanceolatum TaxID=7740 RepID=A0A8J9Z502_BRALA|nr:Hypp7875 [Branchiostoma lanceolatum]